MSHLLVHAAPTKRNLFFPSLQIFCLRLGFHSPKMLRKNSSITSSIRRQSRWDGRMIRSACGFCSKMHEFDFRSRRARKKKAKNLEKREHGVPAVQIVLRQMRCTSNRSLRNTRFNVFVWLTAHSVSLNFDARHRLDEASATGEIQFSWFHILHQRAQATVLTVHQLRQQLAVSSSRRVEIAIASNAKSKGRNTNGNKTVFAFKVASNRFHDYFFLSPFSGFEKNRKFICSRQNIPRFHFCTCFVDGTFRKMMFMIVERQSEVHSYTSARVTSQTIRVNSI